MALPAGDGIARPVRLKNRYPAAAPMGAALLEAPPMIQALSI